jgi:hypothetical protein
MRNFRFLRLLLPVAAVTAIVGIGAPASQGADPFVAGGRSTRGVAVSASQAGEAVARGEALAAALGMPGVSRRSQRLDDRFEHRIYDEIVSFDERGRETAIARFDVDGEVVMAVVLGWRRPDPSPIGRDAAAVRAADFARAAGLTVNGEPLVRASAGAGGWTALWARMVDGIPVVGDGIRISVWSDGSFHGLDRTERPLAPAPANQLGADAAKAAAATLVGTRFGATADDLDLAAAERAWVAPNDTWDPARPDAPDPVLRLAWVVRFEARGPLAERVRFVEYWIDAGDGRLLGGDVVE